MEGSHRAPWLVHTPTRTLCLHTRTISGRQVKEFVYDKEGIPPFLQRVQQERRCVNDTDTFSCKDEDRSFRISLNLDGGKGGFGSMLRALGAQKSGAETDNVEAMRDLSGRRLRHINDEKKIAEWVAAKAKEAQEAKKRKMFKLQRAITAPKHAFDHHALAMELNEKADEIKDAMSQGVKAASVTEKAAAPKPRTKRPALRDEWESDLSDSDESDSGTADQTTAHVTKKLKTVSPVVDSGIESTANEDSKASGSSTSPEPVKSKPTSSKVKGKAANATKAPPKQEEAKKEEKKQKSPPAAPIEPKELDLSKFSSAKELEKEGLDTLKAALMFLGVKCGGSLEQRADRLFSLKDLPRDKIPPSLLAKQKKTKKSN